MEVRKIKDRPGHLLFWWVGIAIAIVPYLAMLIRPEWRAWWFLPPGRFADNIMIVGRHFLIGVTLGGWFWFLVNRVNPLRSVKGWWKQEVPLNWIWFVLSFLIYATHNILLLFNLPFGPGELVFAGLGRALTALIVLSLLWLSAHIASLASPTRFRFLPWAAMAVFPGLLAADALGILFWKNSLKFIVNKIDEEGSFDLAGQLAAAGMTQTSTGILIGVALFVLILCGLCWGAAKLSQWISARHFRPQFALLVLLLAWVGVAAEKGSGFAWKSRKALRMEHNSYDIHLTPLKPEPGLVSFSAVWKDKRRPEIAGTSELRPDIYVIMIESVRADAISPEHAPFLSSFRDQECQQLGRTWAASNATHFSWYSFFNGQLPPFWGEAVDVARAGGELPPSPFIELLKKANYRMEVRTVCDLGYNGMSSTNFGVPHVMDYLKEAAHGSEFDQLTIPQREIENFAEMKEHLQNQPKGGNFHFIALDSPHFTYLWDPSFEPPYDHYDERAAFHAFPNADDIVRIKNRYLNSVAFVDSQIEQFIHTMKKQGQYDDSIIIITGDHGEEFHENGSWFHCSSLEAEQTSVPLMIKWPEGTNLPEHQSASHLDVLPSLLHYFGEADSSYAKLPGRPLLKVNQEEGTQVMMTSLCGITGIAMAWRKGDYSATFRWKAPWSNELPGFLHLDDLEGPEGSLDLTTKEEWEAALWEYFPDVKERLFVNFERK